MMVFVESHATLLSFFVERLNFTLFKNTCNLQVSDTLWSVPSCPD